MNDNVQRKPFLARLFNTPEGVSKMAMVGIGLLILIKLIGSIITGSIGIRADAIHSSIDLVGAFIGFIAIKLAGKPADEGHPYGHHKAENIAALFIALMIFVAAGSILYEAVMRIIEGGTVAMLTVGIWVTVGAIIINLAVSWWALRIAKITDSVALEATGKDLYADVLSSVAVLVGLLLVHFTGIVILDPIAGIIVAILIGKTAWGIFSKSVGELMDKRLPGHELNKIKGIVDGFRGDIVGIKELRTRRAAGNRFVDLTLNVPRLATVAESHDICDRIEAAIHDQIPRSTVYIHCEPCDAPIVDACPDDCPVDRKFCSGKLRRN